MTSTTTYPLIRDNMITLLEALTPTRGADTKFARDEQSVDMLLKAESNPQGCFRRFSIRRETIRDDASTGATDCLIEQVTDKALLVIAYPHYFGLAGEDNLRDLDDLINEDAEQIRQTIGDLGSANYLSGQSVCRSTYQSQEQGEITFLYFELEIKYYQDLT